jgi:hypothetical protein
MVRADSRKNDSPVYIFLRDNNPKNKKQTGCSSMTRNRSTIGMSFEGRFGKITNNGIDAMPRSPGLKAVDFNISTLYYSSALQEKGDSFAEH